MGLFPTVKILIGFLGEASHCWQKTENLALLAQGPTIFDRTMQRPRCTYGAISHNLARDLLGVRVMVVAWGRPVFPLASLSLCTSLALERDYPPWQPSVVSRARGQFRVKSRRSTPRHTNRAVTRIPVMTTDSGLH